MLWVIAIITMALGTLTAIAQKDVKRMLAYSAVAHTGFLLTGVIAASPTGCRPPCSIWRPTGSPRWVRSRSSPWCARPGRP